MHDFAATRELVIETGQCKTSKVADDKQCVRIDRIHMEQVVLHSTHDSAKCRYVPPQHAVEIHASELVGHAGMGSQNLQEKSVVSGVLPEFIIDQVQTLANQSDR